VTEPIETPKPTASLMEVFLEGANGAADVNMVGCLWDIFDELRDKLTRILEYNGLTNSRIREIDDELATYLAENFKQED
jgi:hypothetical protein